MWNQLLSSFQKPRTRSSTKAAREAASKNGNQLEAAKERLANAKNQLKEKDVVPPDMSSSVEMKKSVPDEDWSWFPIDDLCDPQQTAKGLSKIPAKPATAEELKVFFAEKGFKLMTIDELKAENSRDTDEWRMYKEQVEKHGIFSVTSFPKGCELYSLGYLKNRPLYVEQAKKWIEDHNHTEGTHYKFKKIINAVGILFGDTAFLQFEAEDPDHVVKTFESQASSSYSSKSLE